MTSTVTTAFSPTSRPAGAAPSSAGSSTSSRGRSRARTGGAGGLTEPAGAEKPPSRCSHRVAQLGEVYVLLVRHRGGYRIADGFCSVTHMRDGPKPAAGGGSRRAPRSAGFGEQELLAHSAPAHYRKPM